MKMLDIIFVALLFYVGWFGAVFLGRTEFSAASLLFPALLIGFLFFRKSLSRSEFFCAIGVAVSGIFFDLSLFKFGLVSAYGETISIIPVWLVSIWISFAFSMVKLGIRFRPPLWLAALFGFIMGPLSYKSGEFFQVLQFSTSITFLIYAIFWAVSFPLIITLTKRYT